MALYIPFQSLLPLGIVGAALFAGAPLLHYTQRFFNNGKPRRFCLDKWDEMMIERDIKLSGDKNIQLDPTSSN